MSELILLARNIIQWLRKRRDRKRFLRDNMLLISVNKLYPPGQELFAFSERDGYAQAVYGANWKAAIAECDACHLPGDCALCGAEQPQS